MGATFDMIFFLYLLLLISGIRSLDYFYFFFPKEETLYNPIGIENLILLMANFQAFPHLQ